MERYKIMSKAIAISFVFLLLFMGVATLIFPSEDSNEQRKLTELPKFPESFKLVSQYPSQFETYFREHFFFRDNFISFYANTLLFFGTSAVEDVIIGQDDWLFYAGERVLEDYQNIELFTDKELKIWADSLVERQRALKNQGVEYLFVVVPNKHTVYSELLPLHLRKQSGDSRLDQLTQYLSEHTSVNVLDLRAILLSAKKHNLLYWPRNTHWNKAGAYYGQKAIVEKLQNMGFSLNSYEVEPDNWSGQFEKPRQDLSLMLGIKKPEKEFERSYHDSELTCFNSAQYYDWAKGESLDSKIYKSKCSQGSLNVLFFRDSFSIDLIPFFSNIFSESSYVWLQPDEMLFSSLFDPTLDLVIEERVERNLRLLPKPKQWLKVNDNLEKRVLSERFINSDLLLFELNESNIANVKVKYIEKNMREPITLLTKEWNSMLIFSKISFEANKEYIVKLEMNSFHSSQTQLYFQTVDIPKFHASQKIIRKNVAGKHTIYFKLTNIKENSSLRLDPASKQGQYSIHSFQIKEV